MSGVVEARPEEAIHLSYYKLDHQPLRSPDALRVAAVDYIDDRLRIWVVAPPVRPDAGLASKIPHLELSSDETEEALCFREARDSHSLMLFPN